jgi:hypothetical protein
MNAAPAVGMNTSSSPGNQFDGINKYDREAYRAAVAPERFARQPRGILGS